jgi:hypothetical protein
MGGSFGRNSLLDYLKIKINAAIITAEAQSR